ncbi:transport acessory protein MmpS [Mycobacterium sp. SM1]|uniref:MmpS family transport accessory protein n=1 Tax=Mycobacterium sp. SM1 TaxID=2816243 RepID=UPI001BCEA3AA|nr:MmpS family transport accessory protein [Mycobacterium sp. SM1]MBS4730253.1 transport acessory protein MmpS [Mycobacterium sp. SM1]
MNRFSIGQLLQRGWIVLVAVVVVAAAGSGVYRLHGIFGSKDETSTPGPIGNDVNFNPKHIVLEVWGNPGTVATINYLDINVQPQKVMNAHLPWTMEMVTTQPGAFTNVVAQGNSDSLGCRITVDGEVKDERIVNTVNAYTFCLVKSA